VDKPLSEKDKVNPASQAEEQSAASAPSRAGASARTAGHVSNLPNTAGGHYVQNVSTKDLSSSAWEKSKLPWNETVQGRLAVRTLSRGVLGAAFFTMGGWYARRAEGMAGYVPGQKINWKKPLHWVAGGVDTFVGKPISFVVKTVTGSESLGKRAVSFRPTMAHNGYARSLGEEVVGITTDFFCASIGDAMGRDIADMFDRNVEKKWLDKEGHIKPMAAVKGLAKTAWRYVSYNGGEDWAVAIPYAYFIRGQRAVLSKFSPGFEYDSDRSLNGGSHKVDEHGKRVGNYNAVGALDLQSRFTVYNIGTLMYREAYNYVANKMQGKQAHLYGAQDRPVEHRGLLGNAEYLTKWAVRSVLKGTLYMTPSVPFFWITRTPQSKYKGAFINPEKGVMTYEKPGFSATSAPHDMHGVVKANELSLISGNNPGDHPFTRETPVRFSKFNPNKNTWMMSELSQDRNPLRNGKIDVYDRSYSLADGALNAIGAASSGARQVAQDLAVSAKETFSGTQNPMAERALKLSADRFVNASISYTPYMMAKAEFARLWDDGKMDMATERMIDGAFKGNLAEFKTGAREVWRSILRRPLEDPKREAEAQHRINTDISAVADDRTSNAEDFMRKQRRVSLDKRTSHIEQKAAPELSWQERTIQGRTQPTPKDNYAEAMAPSNVSKAEQERMRKFLSEAVPPTNHKH